MVGSQLCGFVEIRCDSALFLDLRFILVLPVLVRILDFGVVRIQRVFVVLLCMLLALAGFHIGCSWVVFGFSCRYIR